MSKRGGTNKSMASTAPEISLGRGIAVPSASSHSTVISDGILVTKSIKGVGSYVPEP